MDYATPAAEVLAELAAEDAADAAAAAGAAPPDPQANATPAAGAADTSPATTTPAQDPQSADQPVAAAAAPKEPAAETPPPPGEDWRRTLDSVDRDELLKHPKLAGLLGDLADRRARRLLQEQTDASRLAQQAQAAQEGDYATLGEAVAPAVLEAQRRQQAAVLQEVSLAPGGVAYSAVESFQRGLSEPAQRALSGKAFEGATNAERFSAYLRAAVDAEVTARLDAAKATWEKDALPGLSAKALADVRSAEPTPDVDGGSAPGRLVITDEMVREASLEQFDAWFDANGRPKPGIVDQTGRRSQRQPAVSGARA